MEKGTIFLEPFWGRQSLKPQRALLLSSTWSTPPGRCSQARWGWCGWRGGRGPGGTGRGPAPDSASSEDTHHSSVITEIEVSPTLAAVSRAQEGEECWVRASQSGHNLYLREVWGVSVWDECLLAWPGLTHLVSVSELGLATDLWLAPHLTGQQLTARAGPHKYKLDKSAVAVTVHCSAGCHWPGLVSASLTITGGVCAWVASIKQPVLFHDSLSGCQ